MCKEIDENVERMGKLMVELGQFTEPQLTAELRKKKSPLVFPLFWNVQRYLDYFQELGVIRSHNGHYEVINA